MSSYCLIPLESPAVQGYLSMLQGIINRMAGNSASCKTWTVTLVTALLVLVLEKDIQLPNPYLCLIPIALLFLLDCYYLGLERITIGIQTDFLSSLSKDPEMYKNQLYDVSKLGSKKLQMCKTIGAMLSFSIVPFYGLVVVIVLYLTGGFKL